MTAQDFSSFEALRRRPAPPRRAVVIGASLAGLLAARVLADHFDEVLLLDRDALPAGNAHRKSTPHSWHAHGLLARGRQVLETLFPGITDEWVAEGGRLGDLQSQVAFYAGRRRFAQAACGVEGVAVGRVVIEGSVRRRVLAHPRVRAFAGVLVHALAWQGAPARVTGVQVQPVGGDAPPVELPAALVIDASGRSSHLPQWLAGMGFEAPAEERVEVDIRYATAYLERRPDDLPGTEVVLCSATADHPMPAVLLGQEGGRWVLTLGGYGPDTPPLDRAGFIERARRCAPEIAEVVQHARFLGEPVAYRFPHSQRRRVERLPRWPDGLLALGDALCSFNPVYGQGMTVAACEALALRDCLAEGGPRLARRFFRRAAAIVDVAWTTAVGADLAIPSVQGARPLPVRLINAYVARLFDAALHDAQVARAFLEVAHLLRQPPSLLRPAIAWRVWRAARRGAAAGATGAPALVR